MSEDKTNTVRYELQDFDTTAQGIADAIVGAHASAKKVVTSPEVREVTYRPTDIYGGTASLRVVFKSKGE